MSNIKSLHFTGRSFVYIDDGLEAGDVKIFKRIEKPSRMSTVNQKANNLNYDLTNLTTGEQLWLWRRRQESPTGRNTGRGGGWMSANEAAAILGVQPDKYDLMERDVCDLPEDLLRSWVVPSAGELCTIARRRSELTIAQACAELGGISKPTLHKWERTDHPELVDLWRRLGFVF